LMDKFADDDSVQVFISTDAGGVGLNLQAATVLINMDMPWNPAILDQRIARIHRLGQQHKVQIFLLLAEESYEQRVAGLVRGKRDLFDNVVSSDATEDVVGVSKKMLETLVDDLAEASGEVKEALAELPEDALPPLSDEQAAPGTVKQTPVEGVEDDQRIHALIVQLQTAFMPRIQRIMGANGGLLVVLESCSEADEQLAETLSQTEVPVAVIAAHTLHSLQRLGLAPASERELLPVIETVAVNPLIKVAADKLQAAELLWQQQCSAGVLDLLAASMLAATTVLAGQTQLPAPESVSVWLYTDILPQQILTAEQVAALVRVMALSQSPQVPETLLEQCLQDARELIAELDG